MDPFGVFRAERDPGIGGLRLVAEIGFEASNCGWPFVLGLGCSLGWRFDVVRVSLVKNVLALRTKLLFGGSTRVGAVGDFEMLGGESSSGVSRGDLRSEGGVLGGMP